MLDNQPTEWPRNKYRGNKRYDPRSECFGKTAYCSKGAAIERIKQSRKHHRKRRSDGWGKSLILTPYRCPHCHHWHVGGTDKFSTDGQSAMKKYR